VSEPVIEIAGPHIVLYAAGSGQTFDGGCFDRRRWLERGARVHSSTGRGGVLILPRGGETWVLRHYHRGGFVARFVYDHYLWTGLARSRPFREWRLLAQLHGEGFPVPRPIAAHVLRRGLVYAADIVTDYLPDTRSLSSHLDDGGPPGAYWPEIGRMLRRFHDRGVDHPDLTAHNILLDPRGGVFLIDFDNAVLRASGAWRQAGVARLERSLRKVALETGTQFDDAGWAAMLAAYAAGAGA
jgi:3-deoxy-D-manno-octulosonic acid kinase